MDASAVGLLVVVLLAGVVYCWHAYGSAGGVRRGFASGMDIVENLSPAHARRKALQTRPATRVLWWSAIREAGLVIGRTVDRPRRLLVATLEDVILFVAGPRTGKTGALACHVRNAVGAVVVTATRADLFLMTIASRWLRPVWVFNPRGVGGVPDAEYRRMGVRELRWCKVLASYDVEHAWMVAQAMVEAGERGDRKDAAHWAQLATRTMRLLLAAAHVGELNMYAVADWVAALAEEGTLDRPTALLKQPAGRETFPGWADELASVAGMNVKTLDSLSGTLVKCVEYMADPQLAYAATPGPDEHFTPEEFLASGGSLYVIGAHEEHSPIGPLFSTFVTYLYEHARRAAASARGGRLDPPMSMILDEAYATFRVPLPRWTSDAGGFGIPIVVAIQGRSQLVEAFGKEGAEIIWQNATTKITFGGQMDPDTVRDLSLLCGERALHIGSTDRVPVLPPGQIRTLSEFEAVVLHRGIPPVMARIPMAWEDPNPPVAEPLDWNPGHGRALVLVGDDRGV